MGMDLSSLDLPQYTSYVLAGWVFVHVLIEVLLEVTKCVAKNNGKRIKASVENELLSWRCLCVYLCGIIVPMTVLELVIRFR